MFITVILFVYGVIKIIKKNTCLAKFNYSSFFVFTFVYFSLATNI